jgi:hypothetical protein
VYLQQVQFEPTAISQQYLKTEVKQEHKLHLQELSQQEQLLGRMFLKVVEAQHQPLVQALKVVVAEEAKKIKFINKNDSLK